MARQLRENFEKIRQEVAARTTAQEALQRLNEELEQRVIERTAEITRQTYILDTFMDNVPDSIYFKDRESRFIRGNRSVAALLGVDDPALLTGKSDFDFFSEEQARPRYVQEQEIMRSGQAILDMEEPDVGERWSLTSKMPLRDEHGEIIGTFGISKNITALKQAEAKIRALNEQLQDENLRMSAEMELARRIQTSLLPPMTTELHPDFETAAFMLPAEEVGGDYYDMMLDQAGALWFGIGDVTGHGVTPGLIMMMAQTIQTAITTNYAASAREVVIMVNRALYKNVHDRLQSDHFMTFTALKYLGAGRFQHAGAHLTLLLYRQRTQTCELIDTPGVWLNLLPDIADCTENAEFEMAIGDRLVLYTDGLTEVFNAHKTMLDISGLTEIVTTHAELEVTAMRDAILRDVLAWSQQTRADDMSLVVVRRVQ
ncbi:MAG: SpoIIE family protein phosphatase, partial [Hyphomicrobiales bacterium]|nr:SpoIIE family protein phosphatase [Hyphomicrobiales bacterium]